jgi:light-harvesting complex 1 beta chain
MTDAQQLLDRHRRTPNRPGADLRCHAPAAIVPSAMRRMPAKRDLGASCAAFALRPASERAGMSRRAVGSDQRSRVRTTRMPRLAPQEGNAAARAAPRNAAASAAASPAAGDVRGFGRKVARGPKGQKEWKTMADGRVVSLSGLTDQEAKEFHGIFMTSFIIFTVIAVIAHFLAWQWRPWLPGPNGYVLRS